MTKFCITFKDPDCLVSAVDSIDWKSMENEEDPPMTEEEKEDYIKVCTKNFITYGEYITIEFDTENPYYAKVK